VVGSDKSVEAPPGVSAALRLFRADVAVLRTTLSGLACLSEHSSRHSGDIGSPHPPRRLDDLEVFCRSACRAIFRPPGRSRRLCLPLRVRARAPSPVRFGTGSPLLGFHAPPATSAKGSVSPGSSTDPAPSVLGVSHPLDGLLSLRPCGHARSAAAHGVLAHLTLSSGEAETRFRASDALSSTVLYSLEL